MSWFERFDDVLYPPKTPECERMAASREEAQVIGDFLEWLQSEYPEEAVYSLVIDNVLHEYFELDKNKIEQERRELLGYQRLLNEFSAIRKQLEPREEVPD